MSIAQYITMSGVDFDGRAYGLSYKFTKSDGGRTSSKRSRQKNDCTVRAVAIALGIAYDDAYDRLAASGRKCSKGFMFSDWIATQSWAKKHSFPAIKGQRRMNPATFCRQFTSGIFIVKTAKHVFAVIDGIVHDEAPQSPDRCIYTAWEIEKNG